MIKCCTIARDVYAYPGHIRFYVAVVTPRGVAFDVTLKPAEGVSPFKPLENKEPPTEQQIIDKLDQAAQRRLVSCNLLWRFHY